MSEVLTGEEEVYRIWPERSQMSPVRREVMEMSGSASVSHLPATKPMSMAAALENLNISYSVGSKCLQSSHGAQVETDENEAQHIYYKPGHRKAYSLPRTLEGGSKWSRRWSWSLPGPRSRGMASSTSPSEDRPRVSTTTAAGEDQEEGGERGEEPGREAGGAFSQLSFIKARLGIHQLADETHI